MMEILNRARHKLKNVLSGRDILRNRKDLYKSFNEIDDHLLERSEINQKKENHTWHKWGVIAACFCIITIGVVAWSMIQTNHNHNAGTLLGAAEIYPTVMVDGSLYEWHNGVAICKVLPENCELYGEITHITEKLPKSNCEFASVFEACGEIYTTSSPDIIYLKLTTSWLDNAIVRFDLVKQTKYYFAFSRREIPMGYFISTLV